MTLICFVLHTKLSAFSHQNLEIDIKEKNIGIANIDRSSQVLERLPVQKDTLFKIILLVKLYTSLFKAQDLENHTLFSNTYLPRPNKGVLPPHPIPVG